MKSTVSYHNEDLTYPSPEGYNRMGWYYLEDNGYLCGPFLTEEEANKEELVYIKYITWLEMAVRR